MTKLSLQQTENSGHLRCKVEDLRENMKLAGTALHSLFHL